MGAIIAKQWTINEIKTACRVAGSHWFDPSTMRFFKCRILPTVYQGSGGIYFVSSEQGPHGPRAYSVRKFTPEGADISTVGQFNEMTKAQAVRLARESAGEDAIARDETYAPVTDLDQFLLDCQRHGTPEAKATDAKELIRLAKKYDKAMVGLCNGDWSCDESGEYPKWVKTLRTLIVANAQRLGAVGVELGGDPRGCVVKLKWADGATNDFGNEGWCVPYSS